MGLTWGDFGGYPWPKTAAKKANPIDDREPTEASEKFRLTRRIHAGRSSSVRKIHRLRSLMQPTGGTV